VAATAASPLRSAAGGAAQVMTTVTGADMADRDQVGRNHV